MTADSTTGVTTRSRGAMPPPNAGGETVPVNWRAAVASYQKADTRRALTQVANTLLPLVGAMYLMYLSLAWSYWITLALAIPTAGFLVRTFIIMHDCGHGSFLPSQRYNNLIGYITGVLTFTPYSEWRHEHAIHHATAGDLDRRGHGDIETLTVDEYLALGTWGRIKYRLYRNPLVLLGLGPFYMMFVQRVPGRYRSSGKPKTASVWTTNLSIVAVVMVLVLAIGIQSVLWVYLPAAYISASAGVYLFFVQHQYDQAYWERHAKWDYATAAVKGSSYFKLPKVLQWFTGNIGLHHVHHLAPRVPNYNLQRAHDEHPLFKTAPVITMAQSIKCLRLALWDEQHKRLVPFSAIRTMQRA
jgi:omega-6 fatty acid desaturase (delta-12 desaturase)